MDRLCNIVPNVWNDSQRAAFWTTMQGIVGSAAALATFVLADIGDGWDATLAAAVGGLVAGGLAIVKLIVSSCLSENGVE